MPALVVLLQQSLPYGVLLSMVLGSLIWGSIYINPEIWVNDYPPDIRAKFGPIGEKAKRQRAILGLLFFPALAGILLLAVVRLFRLTGGTPGFLPIFITVFTILMVFNLVDLLILDGLIAMVIHPKFMELPGTEGMAGYGDFGFHVRGFLIGTVGLGALSLAIAGLAVVVGWIWR
jgi:hypothetical protein